MNKYLFEDRHHYYVRIVRMPATIRWDAVSTELHALAAGAVMQ